MNYRCGDCRCSFEVEHRADSTKVADMHETRAGKMGDVIGEAKVLVKNHTQVADRRIWCECVGGCRVKIEGNGWIWNFLQLLTEAYKDEFSFRRVQAHEI